MVKYKPLLCVYILTLMQTQENMLVESYNGNSWPFVQWSARVAFDVTLSHLIKHQCNIPIGKNI